MDLTPANETVRKAAEKLLKKGRWRNPGYDSDRVWGEVRSRGASYFQVVLAPAEERFYCNCAARQQPCPHVLALAAWSKTEDRWERPSDARPEWVDNFEDRLQTLQEAQAGRELSDEEQRRRQQQRFRNREKRIQQMQAGMKDLKAWLEDVIRQGVAGLESYSDEQWERIAARMVDAKLGSLGRRLRAFPEWIGTPDWTSRALDELGQLFLLASSYERLEELPLNLSDEILSQGGMTIKKEEVLEEDAILDHWVVAGIESGTTEGLTFRRTWLLSTQVERSALLLDFVWGSQPFEQHWRVGQQMDAEIAYYPGAFPQRALIKEFKLRPETEWNLFGYRELEELAEAYAQALGQNPWLQFFPTLLEGVVPVQRDENNWGLVDQQKYLIPLGGESDQHWAVLAQSGGHPVDLFGWFDGRSFRVLSLKTGPRQLIPL